MGKEFRRLIALLLATLLFLSLGTSGLALDAESEELDPGDGEDETIELELEELDPASLHIAKLGTIEDEDLIPSEKKQDLNELIRVSVFLEDPSALDLGYALSGIGLNDAANTYRKTLIGLQNALAGQIERILGYSLNLKWNMTLAVNAFSCYLRLSDLERVEKLPGVASVRPENQYAAQEAETYEPNTANTSEYMTGAAAAWSSGYTGAGSKVAIIDTGVDTSHQSFDAAAFEYSLTRNGNALTDYDLMTQQSWSGMTLNAKNPKYFSSKIPFGYNYVDKNQTIDHMSDTQGEHGSHVAGIATANRYIPSGTSFVDSAIAAHAVGMAPDAQLLVMKVFGSSGGAYDSDYMVAIEDAITLGCDAVNLSLGSSVQGFTYSNGYQELLNSLSDPEHNPATVISISAGNSYDLAKFLPEGALYIEDVDMHTGGSPGTFVNSLCVAAADNIGGTGSTLAVGDTSVFFNPASDGGGDISKVSGSFGFVYIDAKGEAGDYSAVNAAESLNGKVVIINRGTLSFADKATNVNSYRPAALIIANNVPGIFGASVDGYKGSVPVASISLESAEEIKAQSASHAVDGISYYTGTMVISNTVETGLVTERENAQITDFSSWGVPGSLLMKPEITAPGGNIYSVFGTNQTSSGTAGGSDQYESMSGTSMAAPHVAGLSAVLAEYLRENDFSRKNSELTARFSERAIMQSLLMSTATAMRPEGQYLSILQQGAGLVDVNRAIGADSVVMITDSVSLTTRTGAAADGKVKAELGDDPDRDGVYEYTFTIYNLSDQDLDFTVNTELFTQARDGDFMSRDTVDLPCSDSYYWQPIGQLHTEHDVDGSGSTDRQDAQAILDFLAGLRNREELNLDKADLDGDSRISTQDAQLLLNWAAENPEYPDGRVPAHGARWVSVRAELSGTARSALDSQYPNGAYIEGFTYVSCDSKDEEGLSVQDLHSIPILAFYGNWTDPSMFDNTSYLDTFYRRQAKTPYTGNSETNYLSLQQNGVTSIFTGNPYMVEASFPAQRLAINSATVLKSMTYNQVRAAAGKGFAVTRLDEDGQVSQVLKADLGKAPAEGIWYYERQGVWQNTGSETFSVNQRLSALGVKEGDRIRIGFYAIPEYNTMLLADDLTDASAGVLNANSFRQILQENRLGDGAYIGYDFMVDDQAPTVVKAELDGEALHVTAYDDQNLAYVAVTSLDGKVVYAETAPGEPESHLIFDVSQAIGKARGGYVALFVADYAGNETAKAVKVSEFQGIEAGEPIFVLTDTLTPGGEYLILNANAAGTAYALSHSGSNVSKQVVTVQNGGESSAPAFVLSSEVDEESVWTLGGSEGGYTFVNGNNYYLRRSNAGSLQINNTGTVRNTWTWDGANDYLKNGNFYLAYYSNAFNLRTTASKIYLYEKVNDISDPFAVTSVELSNESVNMFVGGTFDLAVTIQPLTVENRSILWTSSRPDVATVDENGTVTAYAAGTTVIQAASEADPDKMAQCRVTVVSVTKDLNALIWDEEGEVFFSRFNTLGLPAWEAQTQTDMPLAAAFVQYSSRELYAASFDGTGSVLYQVDAGTKELTKLGDCMFPLCDMAAGVGSTFVYPMESYVVMADLSEPFDYVNALNLSRYLGDGVYASAIAVDTISATRANYYLLDTLGRIWSFSLSSLRFGTPTLVMDTGIGTDMDYQSLYYDGNYLYWTHYTSNRVELILIDPDTQNVYHVNNFPEGVWPVGGLYVEGQSAPAALDEEIPLIGELLDESETPDLWALLEDPEEEPNSEEMSENTAPEAGDGTEAPEDPEPSGPEQPEPPEAGAVNALREPYFPGYRSLAVGKIFTADESNVSLLLSEQGLTKNGLITLRYDPNLAELIDVESEAELAAVNQSENGILVLAYADLEGIPAGEAVFALRFAVKCEDAAVQAETRERNGALDLQESAQLSVPGAGHEYRLTGWSWSEDLSHANASFVCDRDDAHRLDLEAQITAAKQGTELVYTARVSLDGKEYSDIRALPLGDVTGDGVTDLADVIRLAEYVKARGVGVKIMPFSGDVNLDQTVDLADVILLASYVKACGVGVEIY